MKSGRSCLLLVALGVLLTTSPTTADDAYSFRETDMEDDYGPILTPLRDEIILQNGQNFTITCKGKMPVQIKQEKTPRETHNFYNVTRNLTSLDVNYPYEVALDLYNVDENAVGYYGCFDDTVDSKAILNNLPEEPNNTAHVTYTYIYVNGTDALLAPLSEFFTLTNGNKSVLRCKPTMPDIDISLSLVVYPLIEFEYESYDPKIGITLDNNELKVLLENYDFLFLQCNASRQISPVDEYKQEFVDTRQVFVQQLKSKMPDLKLHGGHKYFMAGENFTLNCSVEYQQNLAIALSWDVPPKARETAFYDSNEFNVVVDGLLFNAIIITNATREHTGPYVCILSSGLQRQKTERREKVFLDQAYLTLKSDVNKKMEVDQKKRLHLKVEVEAYPPPTFIFYKDNERLSLKNSKYSSSVFVTGDVVLTIYNLTITDTANYTIEATNGYVTKNFTYDLRKRERPSVTLSHNREIIMLLNTKVSLECTALGYPLPSVTWVFSSNEVDNSYDKGNYQKISEYKAISKLNVTATKSANITCFASNIKGNDSESVELLVYEIPNGFDILDTLEWYAESQEVSIRCMASIYKFESLTWHGPNNDDVKEYVKYYQTPFSHVAKLKIDEVSLKQAGPYMCVGRKSNESEEILTTYIAIEEMTSADVADYMPHTCWPVPAAVSAKNIEVNVNCVLTDGCDTLLLFFAKQEPIFLEPVIDRDEEVTMFQEVGLSCVADAVPPPTLEWYKDGKLLENNTNGLILYVHTNHSVVNSSIYVARMKDENKGKYECLLLYENLPPQSKFVNLIMNNSMPYKTTIFSVVIVVIFILIVLVIYLTWKIRKEKKFRKELAAAGLLYFKEGVTKSLNPDLGIDEQAELLPYDDRFEFPPEKLILGKQLGAGAFGVVYKAEARGIINAEETTPVAVKMVKKTADNMFIKALASELKIMVHLGKHVNIVNLLGACTKHVGKRELIVIVEYCKFGNIHNYMQKHREVFIDQLTDSSEKNLGKVNRGYSCSTASSGINSDYSGMNHTQATDHTFLNTANTNRSGRKVSETGYVQPQWRSNYESDYSFDGRNPRPLTSRDLLAWAFQIARGMEYLANRKVLHGDLAARNVLLAEDNIVKICDFGLARSIYKNDEYQKKENSPLPVKWLAIECMTDRIFSTQSDIWSFGIVLWEMFSLAKTPYPNMSPQHLLQWLSEGHRLEKPTYADDRLYDVMMRCWAAKPNARPSFTELQELLGSFLEDNVRNHYVDLNSAYMDLNVKTGGEDYLAMVSAPDYNNLVTPSPHHYVNDVTSFFPPTPTQVPLDEEGYLQMSPLNPSIFSPRSASTKFDFDARKFDPRVAEGHGGSELTPMLTLNNLPARSGSDSDHEGHSPYLNMCPKSNEDSDEVFNNQNNMKNIQNSAVTNPTYITLDVDVDIEKKPKDINYINVPNGLVK